MDWNCFLAFGAFCFRGTVPLLTSLHERYFILSLNFISLGHNLQSPDVQLAAVIQKCSNKRTVCKPVTKLGAPLPTPQIYMCFTMWSKE